MLAHVLIVEDDPFNANGLQLCLEGKGYRVSLAGDVGTAWDAAARLRPDAAIVDISLPPEPHPARWPHNTLGLDLARRLKTTYPALAVVIHSSYEYFLEDFQSMLRDGMRGVAYQLKGRRTTLLLDALTQTLEGRIVIDPDVSARHARALADDLLARLTPAERPWVENALTHFDDLTPHEQRAAHLLAASHTTQDIAQRLSLKRADNLISRVYAELGLSDAPLKPMALLIKTCMIHDLLAPGGMHAQSLRV